MDQGPVSYDVVVVGGGAAGLAAAVAAATCGARTALVERYGFLGGMATAGLVGTICGLYHTSTSGDPEPLNEGFAETFARRLMTMPGCDRPVRRGRTFVLPYSPFAFACLADELTTAAGADLDVYLHAWLTAVETRARRIEILRITTWEGATELAARVVVDTSGDAVVAHGAGAATETAPARERQLPSLVFVLQQVDTAVLEGRARVAVLRSLLAAEQEGRLPGGASNLTLGLSPRPGEVVCKLALSGIAHEGSGGRWLTVAEQEGRRRVLAVAGFLKTLPPFARAFVSHAAPQVGVRESRRVIGRYRLTREDVLEGRRFDDGVARASWPIELWQEGRPGAGYDYLGDGQTYDIPLRSLQARELENLFVAGRCMSATHEALGSARVIGTCLAAGEGVGQAAARQARAAGRTGRDPG